jgi:hypothetical protein
MACDFALPILIERVTFFNEENGFGVADNKPVIKPIQAEPT